MEHRNFTSTLRRFTSTLWWRSRDEIHTKEARENPETKTLEKHVTDEWPFLTFSFRTVDFLRSITFFLLFYVILRSHPPPLQLTHYPSVPNFYSSFLSSHQRYVIMRIKGGHKYEFLKLKLYAYESKHMMKYRKNLVSSYFCLFKILWTVYSFGETRSRRLKDSVLTTDYRCILYSCNSTTNFGCLTYFNGPFP